ncbi:type I-E CRISPR-associated protein Cse1/CasA [Planosporangium flavigriseum]|uniref:Type I-E CRISPR-associated protein Cse1/CasA n=1 Tax=Planosporangium flavigriseum TaxID=373681 RepID=A0A8J3LPU1_9ACTN|nr:type I-E CRISPR-associated protein Cse1/CasA [Planosporangium flavigriseum]NJC63071.1 type I-E CRISPR-associated protein Cse1/CasA [Planosporangium flavigriseum]GIG74443.1 type I-E CRISPR-associated protein Cse1/CasA [Planosporangium flavigriseum]
MTGSPRPPEFSLVDEAWIPVLDAAGQRREVSLLGLFEQADDLRMIACELPTQTFAILRLALAILHRATDGPPGEAAWQALWRARQLPLPEVTDYLAAFRDRFDLLHPRHPFYQVADLRAGKDNSFGLERLIADVPNGMPFLTTRAGRGMESISPAEAARWLVHCQAYDPSGIKTGAVGDPRVKGGRGYPIGVGSLGALGGVHLEGASLLESLLLNLVPIAPGWQRADERDLPVWEREPQTATEEPDETRGPYGLLSLYTWQSRRIRLFGDTSGITGAMISNGDKLEWQDRHLLEPMSVWGRSAPREREQKRSPIYLPRPHDHTRALWRGLQTLLPLAPPSGSEPPQRLSPMVLQWLARLTVTGVVEPDFQVRPRATSVTYGTQQAVIDEVFGDALTMNVLLLVDQSPLRTTAVDAAADAEGAVGVLRRLATNLARAAGSRDGDSGEADRAAERGYARLDRAFRDWLARLGPTSDPAAERAWWQRLVWRAVVRLGNDLVAEAGPAAWVGRLGVDRNGREVHYSSSQAEVWFRAGLAKALPMAADPVAKTQEVPA